MQFPVDLSVVAYLMLLCVGSAVACSLVPAWNASPPNLTTTTLNDAGRGSVGGRHRRRWMGGFVVAQVTLALVLLTGAMLMMQNLVNVMRTDVGVETRGLSQTALSVPQSDDTPERRRLFLARLEERLTSSSIVNAAVASAAPLGGGARRRVRIEGQSDIQPEALPSVSLVQVGQNYFDVLGVRVVAGRGWTSNELRQPDDTVIVNERFAQSYFNGSAIGRRIMLTDPGVRADDTLRWTTIVGVVTNVRQRWLPSGDFDPVVYRSYAVDPPQAVEVLARSPTGPVAAAAFVGDQVRALDADLPVPPMLTLDAALAQMLWPQRLFGSIFAVFAAIAMVLAVCGLYAVTAYAVSRRTREIGVRIALGAEARRVWWAIAGATLRQLSIGLVLGTAGAVAVATVLPALLVGTGRPNPLIFAGVALLLLATGVAASVIPARRAMRLDPVSALQAE